MYCYDDSSGNLCIIGFHKNIDPYKEAKRLGISNLQKVDAMPTKRNWRNAWVLRDDVVVIDLERAKRVQKQLAIDIAPLRVEQDARGNINQQQLAAIDAEIEAMDWDAPQTLDELYNTWPASIDFRNGKRTYTL
jgi:hypothetical protein